MRNRLVQWPRPNYDFSLEYRADGGGLSHSFGEENTNGAWEGHSMTSRGSKSEHSTSRRRFLLAAGATGAATVAAPAVVSAQGPISMRWQSTWPSKDIFHEYALDYAKKVNDMTGGDLKIEVLPAGAVVPA